MKKKDISICITTCNRLENLKETILSIYNSDAKNYELIVCDDSRDRLTEEYILKKYPDIIYTHNIPSLGEVENTNMCFSLAKSDIVCLIHDDDKVYKNYFSEPIKIFSTEPEVDIVYYGRKLINQNDDYIKNQIIHNGPKIQFFRTIDIVDNFLLNKKLTNYKIPFVTPGMFIRKKILTLTRGFDNRIDTHCDTDFLLRSFVISNQLCYINKPYYINKVWSDISGRTKSSERGDVFNAQKGVIDNFISFCAEKRIEKYQNCSKEIYKEFANKCTSFNGPISWISFRYKGNYSSRVDKLIRTFREILKLNPSILYYPRLVIVLLLSLLVPRIFHRHIFSILVKYYFK